MGADANVHLGAEVDRQGFFVVSGGSVQIQDRVIGGGIAGLSAAYFLKDSKYNVALIEKDKCGLGATSKNTGKLTFMQDLIYHKIETNYDKETAYLYLRSQKEAIDIVSKIVKENKINCHLTKTRSYIFSNNERSFSRPYRL